MRSRRAIRTYASALLLTLVTVVLGLWSSRLLLPLLGKERFGASRALFDWVGHLGALDLGLAGAIAPLLAGALARGDPGGARALLRLSLRIYAGVALACVGAGLLLDRVLERLVEVAPEDRRDLHLGWWILVAASPAVWAVPPRALLEARQQGWRVNLYLAGQSVVVLGLALVLARAGWGIAGQSTAMAVGMVAFALIVARDALRQDLGRIAPAAPATSQGDAPSIHHEPSPARRLLRLGGPTAILGFCARMALWSDTVVVAALLGAEWVTVLFFTTRLAQLAQVQLAAVGGAAWAALAELDAQGRRETFNRRVVELTRLLTTLGVAALVPIACYARPFVTIWSRDPTVYGGDRVAALASANALLVALWMLWGWCFTGTGRSRWVVAPTVVGSGANLALSLALTGVFDAGVAGPLWGTFLAHAVVQLGWLAWLLNRAFALSPLALASSVIRPLVLGVPLAWGCRWAALQIPPQGLFGLAIQMSAAAMVYLILAFLLVLTPEDRADWRRRIRG